MFCYLKLGYGINISCFGTIFVLFVLCSAGANGEMVSPGPKNQFMDLLKYNSANNTKIGGKGSDTFWPPDFEFFHGLVTSLSVILVSEMGDKTFFIAVIMAMRHSRLIVFLGAIGALALMTVFSAVFGMATTKIPRVYTYYTSTALFAITGLKMLKEGYYMSGIEGQECLEEVRTNLRKCEDEYQQDNAKVLDLNPKSSAAYMMSRLMMQAFVLTFLAEWGDRSQLATIILSVKEDVLGVIVGAVLGHSICTGLAVIGGQIIARRISVRTVTIVGGVFFIFFAISAICVSPVSQTD